MRTLENTILHFNQYEISLKKLFQGWTKDTNSHESTIIRYYVDFKKEFKLPKTYSSDEIMSELIAEYVENQLIILACVVLLENAIMQKVISEKEIPLDLQELYSVMADEDLLWSFLLKYSEKVEILNR